jgi:uncharacterized protein (TIGR02270 family)
VQLARPILWDIYEEHLDEAAFLWVQWQGALCASNYTLGEVVEGPEERLLAQLDGLVLGGKPIAERLVLPALSDDDPGRVSAAAWVLLQAEDADHFDTVWEALSTATDPVRRRALSRGLELSRRSDLSERLLPRLESSTRAAQACLIHAVAGRGAAELAALPLPRWAAEADAELLGALLHAVQRIPDPVYRPLIERGLDAEDVETRGAAIEAGTLLQVPSTRGVCRRLVAERAPDRRFVMGVLALGDEPRDGARLVEWAKAPDLTADALWALGFSGRVGVAELLLEWLDDEKFAAIAAESFSTITGLVLEGPLVKPAESARLEEPFDEDGPVPELSAEEDLPVPDPARVRAWWRSHQSRFHPETRHLRGMPWSAQALRGALSLSPTWRRRVLRLGLTTDVAARIDARQWARLQPL